MKKIGNGSYVLDNPVAIVNTACIVGPKEKAGPLNKFFDKCLDDEFWGEETWEKAESKLVKETANMAINKAGIAVKDIDLCFAGDLINQCISSSFGLRDLNIPFFGVFGACSTFVESNLLGAMTIDGGFATNVLCTSSSHFCSAEKQFRFPLELGNQRPPSSQWTVTGAGSSILSKNGNGPFIKILTPGKIVDMGIKDANNMGAAMAGAALDTLVTHLNDTGRTPDYYDAIFTGDLGYIGKDILMDLSKTNGYNIKSNYNDCGVLIFDKETQDTHSGGSGCACIGTVVSGYFFKQLKEKNLKRILLMATRSFNEFNK
jgi:stage V sporulation protein AD